MLIADKILKTKCVNRDGTLQTVRETGSVNNINFNLLLTPGCHQLELLLEPLIVKL